MRQWNRGFTVSASLQDTLSLMPAECRGETWQAQGDCPKPEGLLLSPNPPKKVQQFHLLPPNDLGTWPFLLYWLCHDRDAKDARVIALADILRRLVALSASDSWSSDKLQAKYPCFQWSSIVTDHELCTALVHLRDAMHILQTPRTTEAPFLEANFTLQLRSSLELRAIWAKLITFVAGLSQDRTWNAMYSWLELGTVSAIEHHLARPKVRVWTVSCVQNQAKLRQTCTSSSSPSERLCIVDCVTML